MRTASRTPASRKKASATNAASKGATGHLYGTAATVTASVRLFSAGIGPATLSSVLSFIFLGVDARAFFLRDYRGVALGDPLDVAPLPLQVVVRVHVHTLAQSGNPGRVPDDPGG